MVVKEYIYPQQKFSIYLGVGFVCNTFTLFQSNKVKTVKNVFNEFNEKQLKINA